MPLPQQQDLDDENGATAEEMTAALEALHDRRRPDQSGVTPQEMRAEVQAQRERWRDDQARRSQDRLAEHKTWRHFWKGAGAGAVGAFMLLAWALSLSTRSRPVAPAVPGAAPVDQSAETEPVSPTERLQPLSSLPDKTPFGCSLYTIDRILSEASPSVIMLTEEEQNRTFDESKATGIDSHAGPDVRSSWTAIKYGGRVYLRGWVPQRLSTPPKPGQAFHVFNSPDVPELGSHPTRITLAATALDYQGIFMRIDNPLYIPLHETKGRPPLYQRLTQEIVVSGVHLDQHAWEKWP